MMTVELFVSDPTLTAERKSELAERLLRELTTEDSAPDAVMDKVRELTHVVVHQPETWATGGPSRQAAPRYLVRLTVPGSWSNHAEFGPTMIPKVTRAIAAFEPDPDRLLHEPHCVVQIVGLKEHSVGTLGQVTDSTDLAKLMTADYQHSGNRAEAPEGYSIDPVCGMTVELATTRLTLTHDGVDYAFCAPVCRKIFAEEHAISA
jgi:YHS domain-containing protein/phenylpyruvate tautomerase PptA (4-oxalocrotonate tautomerase family)